MKKTSPVVKVFIDTNVLVDYLIPDRAGHSAALQVFLLAYSHYIEVAVSTQSILDASFICGKVPGFSSESPGSFCEQLPGLTYADALKLRTASP